MNKKGIKVIVGAAIVTVAGYYFLDVRHGWQYIKARLALKKKPEEEPTSDIKNFVEVKKRKK